LQESAELNLDLDLQPALLAAAALDGLFEHPAGYSGTISIREIAAPYCGNTEFSAAC
jgi:hypothetical protein